MPRLTFSHAPMGGGKSMAALVLHQHAKDRGLHSVLLVTNPRTEGLVHSRSGLSAPAVEFSEDTDLFEYIHHLHKERPIHQIVADEAHFYTEKQIDELAQVVDILKINVEAYGLLTDYRTKLFSGSKRLIEIADMIIPLHTSPLCACGRSATHNARLVDGRMVLDGEQILVGDVTDSRIRYEVVCRKCHKATERHFQDSLFDVDSLSNGD